MSGFLRLKRLVLPLAVVSAGVAITSLPTGVGATACPSGWTQVGQTDVCELIVTASGSITLPSEYSSFDVVVVGGGGGGGGGFAKKLGAGSDKQTAGGGGGGGEVVTCTALALSGTVAVTVGAGGAGGAESTDDSPTSPQGSDGADGTTSSISSCSADGGKAGRAGAWNVAFNTAVIGTGGESGSGKSGGGPQFISCVVPCWHVTSGGGGGGDSANGTGPLGSGRGGYGGDGTAPTGGLFAGNIVKYGGGGGGGGSKYTADPTSLGGAGGGGSGAFWSSAQTPNLSTAIPGTVNTGGGGGGGQGATNPNEVARPGASGGSGVVILRLDTTTASTTTTQAPIIFIPPTTTATTTSSTKTTATPSIPVVNNEGQLPEATPGSGSVTEGGQTVDVDLFVENDTALVLRGQDFELRLSGQCDTTCQIITLPNSRETIRLQERGLANVSGYGFLPGSLVYVWLFSEPKLLGQLTVTEDGTFVGQLPLEGIAPGEHTLQVNGTSFDGVGRSANLGVIVDKAESTLPATGSNSADTSRWALLLLSCGGLLIVAGRRRRMSSH